MALFVCGCATHRDDTEIERHQVEPRSEALVAGRDFTCSLRESGEVSCWGGRYSPVTSTLVHGRPVENAAQLAIGATHEPESIPEPLCIIDDQGKVRCDFPVSDLEPASDIAVGYGHACAVLGEKVGCWAIEKSSFDLWVERYDVPNAVEVAVARDHACALARDGRVWCWGLEGDDCPPTWMFRLGVGVDLSSRVDTCVVDVDGAVRCLAPTSCPKPFDAVADAGPAHEVTAGYTMNCARTDDEVRCWPASQPDGEAPIASLLEAVPFGDDEKKLRALAVGSKHACVGTSTGVECWGSNERRQLYGEDQPIVVEQPRRVGSIDDFTEVFVGDRQSCAHQVNGTIHCWGLLPSGEWSGTPTQISTFDGGALLGVGLHGEIGVLTRDHSLAYVSPTQLGPRWPELGAELLSMPPERMEMITFEDSKMLVCGLARSRSPVCATTNTSPQELTSVRDLALCQGRAWLIDADGGVSLAKPVEGQAITQHVRSVELAAPAVRITCSKADACALLEVGSVACWSDDFQNSPAKYKHSPRMFDFEIPATGVAMGSDTACAWRRDGRVECWGDPADWVLGFAGGRTLAESPPLELPGIIDAIQVSLSASHACVLHVGGAVSCWGNSFYGEAGGGSGEWKLDPIEVALPNL